MFLNLGKGPGCHYPAPGYGIHSIYIYTPHSILTIWPFPTSHPVAFSLFRYRSTFGHRLTRAPEPFASRPSLEPEAPCAQPRHAVDHGVSPHNGIQWLGEGGGLTFQRFTRWGCSRKGGHVWRIIRWKNRLYRHTYIIMYIYIYPYSTAIFDSSCICMNTLPPIYCCSKLLGVPQHVIAYCARPT